MKKKKLKERIATLERRVAILEALEQRVAVLEVAGFPVPQTIRITPYPAPPYEVKWRQGTYSGDDVRPDINAT